MTSYAGISIVILSEYILEKWLNKCFKNTYVFRKGGRGGPNAITASPFLTSLLLRFWLSFSKFRLNNNL